MAAPAVTWFEVTGKDGPALQQFYGELFDWDIHDAGDESGYGLVAPGEDGIAGGVGASQDEGPGRLTFYVEVDDPASYLQRAEELGGRTIAPPMDLEEFGLTLAFFADPEGHVVGLSKGTAR